MQSFGSRPNSAKKYLQINYLPGPNLYNPKTNFIYKSNGSSKYDYIDLEMLLKLWFKKWIKFQVLKHISNNQYKNFYKQAHHGRCQLQKDNLLIIQVLFLVLELTN